jgi:hypothetical protein
MSLAGPVMSVAVFVRPPARRADMIGPSVTTPLRFQHPFRLRFDLVAVLLVVGCTAKPRHTPPRPDSSAATNRIETPVVVRPSPLLKVEFDNDRIRVLRIRYVPHERRPVEDHPASLTIALTPAIVRVIRPDGSSSESRLSAGAVAWRDAARYAVENLSAESIELIEVGIRHATAPAIALVPRPSTSDSAVREPMPPSLEPHHHVTYENQYVRAMTVTLEPGEGSLFHTHTLDVLYVTLADARARGQVHGAAWGPEIAFTHGDVSFDEASKQPFTHHLQNVGMARFQTINVEILP